MQTTTTHLTETSTDGRHGFDVLLGRWNVHNRVLARRLEASNEWQDFSATYEMRSLLGGLCNISTYAATLPTGKPIEGILLRCFNPQTGKWSVYWNDSIQCELQPPVIGEFQGDRIELYGDDTFKGAPIRVRCIYEKVDADAVRWEQAFWDDRANNWETNWIMEFKRDSAALSVIPSPTEAQTNLDRSPTLNPAEELADGRHDFDFLVGRWSVRNRRLAKRLERNTEWQEFAAQNETRPLLAGLCNLDTYDATFPDSRHVQGLTLRCFNPQTRQWSIYWNDSVQCELQPPVIGSFQENRGEFYGDDTFNGTRIRVRYVWLKLTADAATWEQAFSQDNGQSWETNWVMEFERVSPGPGSVQ